jgi:hypothetical protein
MERPWPPEQVPPVKIMFLLVLVGVSFEVCLAAYLAGVNSQAVVLVLDVGVADGDVGGLADIEGIGVVATTAVTVRVVNGDVIKDQVVGLYTESLHGGVLDVQVRDGRVGHGVGVEELGLGLAAVGSLAVPPAGTATVDDMARGTGDLEVLTGEADEGAFPLLVSEGGLALEGNLNNTVNDIVRSECWIKLPWCHPSGWKGQGSRRQGP